jgi:hypothetical protein
LDKHAHLQFYTADKRHVLSFVDYRRFGRWEEGADWGRDRGPDPVYEHDAFRLNVLNSLQVWLGYMDASVPVFRIRTLFLFYPDLDPAI